MKIVCDENIPKAEFYFSRFGQLNLYPGRAIKAEHVRDADILLVRSITRVDENLLAGSQVSFVGTTTIGEDHIDKDYLIRSNVAFSSAPGCNANSVAEYVLAALFDWWKNPLVEKHKNRLSDISVGIIGVGNVGSRVKYFCETLGMHTFCYDPFLPKYSHLRRCDCTQADVVTFHTPLTIDGRYPTYHYADQAFMEKLKPGALLINTARGGVVDSRALLRLLDKKPKLCAVLDVWEQEPEIDQLLLERCYIGTPHIAGYSFDGKVRGTQMIYDALCRHLEKSPDYVDEEGEPLTTIPDSIIQGSENFIADVIRYVYSIREDDRRLRELAENSENMHQLAQGFDALRKYYPRRREFGSYQVNTTGMQPGLKQLIKELGFKTKG